MLFQNQKRMVLLPEEVGEKGFLESCSLYVPDRLVWKRHAEDRFSGSRLEAEGINVLWMNFILTVLKILINPHPKRLC
ncbi:hypothetical protein TNCV_2796521 [Trichonephila clavipes]|nr:hypothetical protein TNCV_2796521 [Trichonephila clavipes]